VAYIQLRVCPPARLVVKLLQGLDIVQIQKRECECRVLDGPALWETGPKGRNELDCMRGKGVRGGCSCIELRIRAPARLLVSRVVKEP